MVVIVAISLSNVVTALANGRLKREARAGK
jgi:hypothetical protein